MLDLKPEQKIFLRKVFQEKLPHAKVWAYGSRTQGKARAYSDLDLAIDNGDELSIAQLASLREAFEESDLPFFVDLVDLQRVSPCFHQSIMNDAQRL